MSLSNPQFHAAVVEFVNRCLCPEIGLFRQERLKMILRAEDGEAFVQFHKAHHHVLFSDLAKVERQLTAFLMVFHLPKFCDVSIR